MNVHHTIPMQKAKDAKKQEQKEMLGLLLIVIIGLIFASVPIIESYMDKVLDKVIK